MSPTRFLILLSSLLCLVGCGYSFVLKGGGNLGAVRLSPCDNRTPLREAALVLDAQMERELSAMGMLATGGDLPRLGCTIVRASSREITSASLTRDDRYRLNVTVRAVLTDAGGKALWLSDFTDDGAYTDGGQEEDALEEACQGIASQISRALTCLTL